MPITNYTLVSIFIYMETAQQQKKILLKIWLTDYLLFIGNYILKFTQICTATSANNIAQNSIKVSDLCLFFFFFFDKKNFMALFVDKIQLPEAYTATTKS